MQQQEDKDILDYRRGRMRILMIVLAIVTVFFLTAGIIVMIRDGRKGSANDDNSRLIPKNYYDTATEDTATEDTATEDTAQSSENGQEQDKDKPEEAAKNDKAEAAELREKTFEDLETAEEASLRPQYVVPVFSKTEDTVSLPKDEDLLKYDDLIELEPLPDAAKPYREEENLKAEYGSLASSYMILVDLDTNTVVAERDSDTIMNPASMTKVLTIIAASDHITPEDLNKKTKISQYAVDYAKINDCSAVCYQPDHEATVRELFYGTIVCSGADAAIALAEYVAGSEEAFVDMMNEKVEEFGLSETAHFTNPVGMYDENNQCRVGDIAVILACAMQNDFLRNVLGTRRYLCSVKNDEGQYVELDNMFLLRIDGREVNGKILSAKTGYLVKAGHCAASMLETPEGKRYICVTGNSGDSWRTICDHISVYRAYTK